MEQMTTCLSADEALARKAEVRRSFTERNLRTACFILVDLPELGLIKKGQIAQLTGFAPLNHESVYNIIH